MAKCDMCGFVDPVGGLTPAKVFSKAAVDRNICQVCACFYTGDEDLYRLINLIRTDLKTCQELLDKANGK